MVLQLWEQRFHALKPSVPQVAHLAHQGQGLLHTVFQQLGARDAVGVFGPAQRQLAFGKEGFQRIAQLEFVAQAQLDVDALNAQRVLTHARQGNDHVFVDLESVGVFADGGGSLAVEPEFFARFRADGHKAFADATVGQTDDLAGGLGHRVFVVAHDVANEHHLGQTAIAFFAFGRITHGLEVAVIQVFQAGQHDPRSGLLGEHVILDVHNGRHAVFGVAKELQTHRSHVRRHAVHHPARAGDEAITAFFLDAGQTAQKLVGHVLAQTFFAEGLARDGELFGAQRGFAVRRKVTQLKGGNFSVVDLAQVVVGAHHLQPLGLRRDHAPAQQVVQRRAPQHGFFAARVHGDVATHTRRLRAGGIDREHKTGPFGRIGHALGDYASFGPNRGQGLVVAADLNVLDFRHGFELFGVDHHALPRQRDRAAGVTGAAAARDDGQPEFDTTFDQQCHFGLGVGREHHKRVFHAPIGGVGDVADTRQTIEFDVVAGGELAQHLLGLLAQAGHLVKAGRESLHRGASRLQQLANPSVARGIVGRNAAFLYLAQSVAQGLNQLLTPLGRLQQIVLQVGVALDHPNITQNLVEHAR